MISFIFAYRDLFIELKFDFIMNTNKSSNENIHLKKKSINFDFIEIGEREREKKNDRLDRTGPDEIELSGTQVQRLKKHSLKSSSS